MHMKKNPYNWGKNTEWVLTPVQSLSLKDEQNKPIPMSNLTEPVRITTPIASECFFLACRHVIIHHKGSGR